jgi:hypothetical protein
MTATYDGDYFFMVGGGRRSSTATGDRKPDVYVPAGRAPGLALAQRQRHGRRAEVRASFESGLELENVTGAYPLDIDGDGVMDLVLLRVGENVVMRGKGECRFERANEAWGFHGGDAWSTPSPRPGSRGRWPTLAIGNYIDRTAGDRFPGAPAPTIGCIGRAGRGGSRRRWR